ncbi:MAG: hypothetical protein ACJAYU_005255 [Bradymonadia bacterium]|jgi:hypothetical protein
MTNSLIRPLLALLCLLSAGCDLRLAELEAALADSGVQADTGPSLEEILANEQCEGLVAEDFRCGGDPVGTWEIVRSCPAVDAFDPLNATCAELSVEGQGEAVGRVEFRGDGTYELTIEPRILEVSFTFPLACFGGSTEPCDGSNFFGSCAVVGSECVCDVTRTRGAIEEQGTWVRFFSDIQFSPDAETLIDAQICRFDAVMRMVRFSPIEEELDWGFILRQVDDLDY